jgi:hypothetical protein
METSTGVPAGFPLTQFALNEPEWDEAVGTTEPRGIGTSSIKWAPRSQPVSPSLVGVLDGRRIFQIRYSDLLVALLEEQGASYCPFLITEADVSVVAFFGQPEIFTWEGVSLLTMRSYGQGMGAIQDQLFMRRLNEQLVELKVELAGRPFPSGVTESHRGGGFCRRSLIYENLTGNDSSKQGTVQVRYRLSDRALRVASVTVLPGARIRSATSTSNYVVDIDAGRRLSTYFSTFYFALSTFAIRPVSPYPPRCS